MEWAHYGPLLLSKLLANRHLQWKRGIIFHSTNVYDVTSNILIRSIVCMERRLRLCFPCSAGGQPPRAGIPAPRPRGKPDLPRLELRLLPLLRWRLLLRPSPTQVCLRPRWHGGQVCSVFHAYAIVHVHGDVILAKRRLRIPQLSLKSGLHLRSHPSTPACRGQRPAPQAVLRRLSVAEVECCSARRMQAELLGLGFRESASALNSLALGWFSALFLVDQPQPPPPPSSPRPARAR